MTDFEDFCIAVKHMRCAQKEYFSTRSHDALVRSKYLEKRVDQLLNESGVIIINDDL